MNTHQSWLDAFKQSPAFERLKKQPIAYLCAEYSLFPELQSYAGGLGILAGDTIREVADQEIPFIGIGLYYHDGFLHYDFSADDVVLKNKPLEHPDQAGLTLLKKQDERVLVTVPLQERQVKAQVWTTTIGSVSLYFLDSNIEENEMQDRDITSRLYIGNKEIRFEQEMFLGVGGFRLLQTLGIDPILYHLNEGHSALLVMEQVQQHMREHGLGMQEALELARKKIVFTNHTLVAAGNDVFSTDLVAMLLTAYAQEVKIPIDKLIALGKVPDTNLFALTHLALRSAGGINAVSELHAKKASDMWKEFPSFAITNGIHQGTWDAVGTGNVVQKHQENKKVLLTTIRDVTGQEWKEDTLLIGWARRMVGYKRPLALFDDLARFISIAQKEGKHVRVVIAGQAHESDKEGRRNLEKIQGYIHNELDGLVVYLPNYNAALGRMLTAGCDVWLNTPVVGFEACGTSGMKAMLNGTLPCTTKDGWVDEVDMSGKGFLLDSDHITKSLLDTIEQQIAPMYYDDKQMWEKYMHTSRDSILQDFLTTRMLRKYIERLYMPVLEQSIDRLRT